MRAAPDSRVLALWRYKHLIADPAAPGPVWHTGDAARRLLAEPETWALLGMAGDIAHFSVDVSHLETPETEPPFAGVGEFSICAPSARCSGAPTAPSWPTPGAWCTGINATGFAAVCGSPAALAQGVMCANAPTRHAASPTFATDPAVIMLGHPRRSMPARAAENMARRDALHPRRLRRARRKPRGSGGPRIFEEAGVTVDTPRYHSSQPWPFPASIMLGFHAEARDLHIAVDTEELETAAWYSRDALLASPENETFRLPRKDSIARHLVDDWLFDRA